MSYDGCLILDLLSFSCFQRPEESLQHRLVRANIMAYYLQPTWAQLVVGGPASVGGPQKTTWTRLLPPSGTPTATGKTTATAAAAEALWSCPSHSHTTSSSSSSHTSCQGIEGASSSLSEETTATEVLSAIAVSLSVTSGSRAVTTKRSSSSWWGSVFAFFLLVSLASLGEDCCVDSRVVSRQQARFISPSWSSRNTQAMSNTLLAATTTTTTPPAAASPTCLGGGNTPKVTAIDDPTATRAFLSWAKEVGIECPKIEVYRSAATGLRGLRAVADIVDGEVFLRVPLSVCLSPSPSTSSSSSLVWQARLALRLIEESRLRERSHWHPYMLALLDEATRADLRASLPVHWPDDLLDEGGDDAMSMADLVTEARRAKAWRDDQWIAVMQQQQHRQSGNTALDNTGSPPVTREEFDWALDCVQTRNCRVGSSSGSNSGDDDARNVLSPFFDLMNHDPSINSVFFLAELHDNDNHEASYSTSSSSSSMLMLCVCYEGHGVDKGGDVCLNYRNVNVAANEGDTTEQPALFGPDYYLFSYGFIPSPSPSDDSSSSSLFVEVSLPRARVRDVLMADLIGVGVGAGAGTSPSSSQSWHLPVSRVARVLGVRLSSPFPVFADGVGEQLMTALRLLAVAAADPSDTDYADETLLIKAVGTGATVDVETRAMDILDETLYTAVMSLTRVVEANDGEQHPPRSLLLALAQHKLKILIDCQQWAQAYRNTLITTP